MAKPQTVGAGVVNIPHSTFNEWVTTFLPHTNPPVFYAFGKLKDKTDSIEVPWSMDTEAQPVPPAVK
jgi:hypothetical protein